MTTPTELQDRQGDPFADWIEQVNAWPLAATRPAWPDRRCRSCGASEASCEARLIAVSWPCCNPADCNHDCDDADATDHQAGKAKPTDRTRKDKP